MVSTLERGDRVVSILERGDSERKLVQVECTECGALTWNTNIKLCERCFRYKDDFEVK